MDRVFFWCGQPDWMSGLRHRSSGPADFDARLFDRMQWPCREKPPDSFGASGIEAGSPTRQYRDRHADDPLAPVLCFLPSGSGSPHRTDVKIRCCTTKPSDRFDVSDSPSLDRFLVLRWETALFCLAFTRPLSAVSLDASMGDRDGPPARDPRSDARSTLAQPCC